MASKSIHHQGSIGFAKGGLVVIKTNTLLWQRHHRNYAPCPLQKEPWHATTKLDLWYKRPKASNTLCMTEENRRGQSTPPAASEKIIIAASEKMDYLRKLAIYYKGRERTHNVLCQPEGKSWPQVLSDWTARYPNCFTINLGHSLCLAQYPISDRGQTPVLLGSTLQNLRFCLIWEAWICRCIQKYCKMFISQCVDTKKIPATL